MEDGFSYVFSLNTFNDKLYAGGNFYTETNEKPVDETSRNFQVYDGDKWERVDGWQQSGAVGYIKAMAKMGNELYLAGYFQEYNGDLANSIVKYDGEFFYNLGSGVQDYIVRTMCTYNNELFVAGGFYSVGNVPAYNIAKWDGVRWCNLSNDAFNNNIAGLEFYHDTLYVSSNFTTVGNDSIYALAKWIGNSSMEDSCAPPAIVKKVNYNLGFNENTLLNLKLNIYPNPVSDLLLVEKLKNAGEFEYKLLDLNGKEIKRGNITEVKTEIDVSIFETGLYLIEIFNKTERLSKKIMIE